MSEKVITRFAPSPTGLFHVGSVRTALFSYLYARKHKGKFILRIEDTDKARSTKENEKDITDSLTWLNLEHDEFFRQSERTAIYKEHLQKLIDEGKAYISKEEPKEPGDRAEVIRFKNPNKTVSFQDEIRGVVEFDTTELKDFVIAKSLEEPVFHFVVVLDDHLMGVTHVIRGEDHISNTPRQILIQEALGASRPIYAHLPLILAEDRSKLSKRKHGERVSLQYYKSQGFLAEALINYSALLGWNPGTDQEIFTIEELIAHFDLEKVQKSGAIFNEEKLRWINKEWMRKMAEGDLLQKVNEIISQKYIASPELLKKITPVVLERASTFGDIKTMLENGEIDYIFTEPKFDLQDLLWKGKGDLQTTKTRLQKVIELSQDIKDEKFDRDSVKAAIWEYAEQEGRGEVLWPLRYSLTGKEKSPDPFIVAELLGKQGTLQRLESVVSRL